MSRGSKTTVWAILSLLILAGVIGTMIYFATRPRNPSASDPNTGGPDTWDAATTQYIADEHNRAQLAMQHNEFTQARSVLQPLVEKYPKDAIGHAMLAKALIAQAQWKQAYQQAQIACQLDDKLVDAHMLAGVIAERFDDLQSAREHYQRVTQLKPDSLQATLYLANACMKLKDWANADIYALRVLRLDPSQAIAYAITAQVAENQGQTDRAIEQWEKALIHLKPEDPKYVPYTLQRVRLLRRRDMTGRSEALNVLMALPQQMRENQRLVTEELAQTYLSLERPADAADTWVAWLKLHPTDGPAAAQAGLDAHRAGQDDRARQLLALAKRIAPQHPLTEALEQAIGERATSQQP